MLTRRQRAIDRLCDLLLVLGLAGGVAFTAVVMVIMLVMLVVAVWQ